MREAAQKTVGKLAIKIMVGQIILVIACVPRLKSESEPY